MDPDQEKLIRKKLGDVFSPLDPAIFSPIKILFYSDIQSFGGVIQSIKIKMENFGFPSGLVFIDDSESRTADLISDPHLGGQGFDQGRLSRSHLSLKHPNLLLPRCRNNLASSGINLLQLVLKGDQNKSSVWR